MPTAAAFVAQPLDLGSGDFVAALRRTEDVAISPSGRRLAVAAFARGSLGIVELDRADGALARATRVTELASPLLRAPHGLDFVDDDVLVTANREGSVEFFRLVASDVDGRLTLEPLDVVGGALSDISSPGAVAVDRQADGSFDLIVCDNRGHRVTSHRAVLAGDAVRVVADDVIVSRWLDVPDGVALDGRWLAVSNHFHHLVTVYDRGRLASGDDEPAAVLRGCRYAHGLCFGREGRFLLVADAGAAFVNVYERPGAAWHGALYPTRALRVTTDAVVEQAPNEEEGGPKGIAVFPDGRHLVLTSETVPLVVYEVSALLDGNLGREFDAGMRMGYELAVLDSNDRRARDLAALRRHSLRRLRRAPSGLRDRLRWRRGDVAEWWYRRQRARSRAMATSSAATARRR